MSLLGGLEAGGTKFRAAIGTAPDDIRSEIRIETHSPERTLTEVVSFFRGAGRELSAIGLGCFGPVDLNPESKTYGYITDTPKDGWSHTNIVGHLRDALGVPLGFDTDVAAAALGERQWGAAEGIDDFVYLTVGTGIGGAVIVDSKVLHGLVRPEIGHMRIPRQRDDNFRGVCPFHGDCLEGLASGPAIWERWKVTRNELPPAHPAWGLEANYLALGLVNLILTVSPRRIVIGGGVMEQDQLFPLVRARVSELLGGYVQVSELNAAIDDFIVPARLGSQSGVLGAMVLAMRAGAERPGGGGR